MKKYAKRLLAVILAALQLFTLCGCKALDEMRSAQAYLDPDGNVLWNGGVYKKLPESEYLCPANEYEKMVHVTEEDVPVLLSSMFSVMDFHISKDDRFLLEFSEGYYYCEASIYEEILERIHKPFVSEVVCYSYEVYGDDPYEAEAAQYTLTQEQVAVITTVVENTEPTTMQEGMYLDTEWSVALEECSKDMLFRRSAMSISCAGNSYYLELFADQEALLFQVPAGCNDQFDQITKAYRESMESWDAFWGEGFYDEYEDENYA